MTDFLAPAGPRDRVRRTQPPDVTAGTARVLNLVVIPSVQQHQKYWYGVFQLQRTMRPSMPKAKIAIAAQARIRAALTSPRPEDRPSSVVCFFARLASTSATGAIRPPTISQDKTNATTAVMRAATAVELVGCRGVRGCPCCAGGQAGCGSCPCGDTCC